MTAISPGTHLVVGEAFTETIPAGTPHLREADQHIAYVLANGSTEDRGPMSSTGPRHHLTVEAPVPTPDEFQPGTVAWVRIELAQNGDWQDAEGDYIFGSQALRRFLDAGTARLTHVPTPPAMTREQAEQILAGAPADVRAAVEVLRGGGEA